MAAVADGVLDRFSAPDPGVVRDELRRAHRRPGAGLARDRGRRPHAPARPDRLGQDARRVPLGDRPARQRRRSRPRASAAASSTSRRCARSPSTSRRTCARRSPGITLAAERLGAPFTPPTVAMRTGDTPAKERQHLARTPPDILITTPESLYLMLTSQAREILRSVETVIVDEIHALAPTKRGAHLALSLERLDAITDAPPQRIGLSATQRPLDEIARFLGGQTAAGAAPGHRSSTPGSRKELDIEVIVPVDDMTEPGAHSQASGATADALGLDDPEADKSIWPHVHPRVLELIRAHRTTIVFCNARRTRRAARRAASTSSRARSSCARTTVRSSREQRAAGRVRAEGRPAARHRRDVAASSSASTWARSTSSCWSSRRARSRAACSASAAPATRSASRARARSSRSTAATCSRPRSSCGACARASSRRCATRATRSTCSRSRSSPRPRSTSGTSTTCSRSCAGAANFAELSDDVFRETLDMLAGRYPSDQFAGLRPRVVWDRVAEPRARPRRRAARRGRERRHDPRPRPVRRVPARRRRASASSTRRWSTRAGSASASCSARRRGASRRSPSTASSSRPRPGEPAKTPFWKGDQPGPPARARPRARRAGPRAARAAAATRPRRALARRRARRRAPRRTCAPYLDEQAEATGAVPDDRTIVIERFPDEIGDWRVCILTPFGARVHAPWALAIEERLARLDLPVQVLWSDDGIICRLPESLDDDPARRAARPIPTSSTSSSSRGLPSTSLFASRFRENAARALLLPRRRPGERTPLWQQRQRAADLLEVASRLSRRSRSCSRRRASACATSSTSPRCARCSPTIRSRTRARRAGRDPPRVAVRADPAVRLDRGVHVRGRRAARRTPRRRARARPRPAARPPRRRGAARAARPGGDRRARARAATARARHARPATPTTCTTSSPTSGRSTPTRSRARCAADPAALARRAACANAASSRSAARLAAAEDAARLRDALGSRSRRACRPRSPIRSTAPLDDLVARYARTHVPFTIDELIGAASAISAERARAALHAARGRRPGRARRVPARRRRARVVRRRRAARRCAGARSPRCATRSSRSTPSTFARFLAAWHGIGRGRRGTDALVEAIEQLQGVAIPASVLERDVLPARVDGYRPGDARRAVRGRRAGVDRRGRARRRRRPRAPVLPRPGASCSRRRPRCSRRARRPAARRDPRPPRCAPARRSGPTSSPRPAPPTTAVAAHRAVGPRVGGRGHQRHVRAAARAAPARGAPAPSRGPPAPGPARRASARPRAPGRWSLVAPLLEPAPSPTEIAHATALQLLERHGVVTREAVRAEGTPGGFAGVYPVLRALEESGRARRGWFVAGLGAAQFALPGAVDRLRAHRTADADEPGARRSCSPPPIPRSRTAPRCPGPSTRAAAGRPRAAGAHVVLVDGECVAYVERGGTDAAHVQRRAPATDEPDAWVDALVEAHKEGRLGRLQIERIDDEPARTSPHAAAPARRRLRRRLQGPHAPQVASPARTALASEVDMGFLDKVKDAAGKAADQAKHATAVGKEKLEDTRLQKKINDLCQEIGALVVAQRRNEAPDDAAAQIDAKVAEIAEIEKQMEANNVAGEADGAAGRRAAA